jgi:hypothetical protein
MSFHRAYSALDQGQESEGASSEARSGRGRGQAITADRARPEFHAMTEDGEPEDPSRLREERLGIKIGKMIFWSIRQVSPDGHDAYTIERPTEAAD